MYLESPLLLNFKPTSFPKLIFQHQLPQVRYLGLAVDVAHRQTNTFPKDYHYDVMGGKVGIIFT